MTDIPVLSGEVSLWSWQPPGPVAEAYLHSASPLPFIMGPQGSGKTQTSCVKCALTTLRTPVMDDGVIRAVGCVVRENYRTLYRTTLKSWFQVFPRDWPGSKFEGGQDRPAKHTITFRTPAGQLVQMEVDFYAVGDHAIEDLLKGYEPTWSWLNEADQLHEGVWPFMYGRTGRYPPRSRLRDPNAASPRQVFGDLNPPDVDHPIFKHFKETPREGYRLFEQPSGLSDEAENRRGVPRSYYEQNAKTMDERDVIRLVHGRFGYSLTGKPVYSDFNERIHVATANIDPDPNLPLHGGFDQGLSPAMILFQELPNGQIRVYAEVVPPHGTGPARFAEMCARVLSEERFRKCPRGRFTADPAGWYGADRAGGELAWSEAISLALGVYLMPAETQDVGVRIDALRLPMTTLIDGRHPGLLIDPRCRMLISGLVANYKYPKQRQNQKDVFGDRPVKNEYSHPVEAGQYGVLGVRGRAGIIQAGARAGRPGNLVVPDTGRRQPTDFNVWSV